MGVTEAAREGGAWVWSEAWTSLRASGVLAPETDSLEETWTPSKAAGGRSPGPAPSPPAGPVPPANPDGLLGV